MQFLAEIWRWSEFIQILGDFSKTIGEKSPIRRQRDILEKILVRLNRPSLGEQVERLGTEQWVITASRLKSRYKLFAQAFFAVAKLMTIYSIKQAKTTGIMLPL